MVQYFIPIQDDFLHAHSGVLPDCGNKIKAIKAIAYSGSFITVSNTLPAYFYSFTSPCTGETGKKEK